MRPTSLRLLLSGCAFLALAAPAAAQDAPAIIIDPPLRDGAPVSVPRPADEAVTPEGGGGPNYPNM